MTSTTGVPVRVMSPRETRDVELVLDGVLPSGHLLGGGVATTPFLRDRFGGPISAGLSVDPGQGRRALEAGAIMLVDQEQTPLAVLTEIRATQRDAAAVGDGAVLTGILARKRQRESGSGRDLAADLSSSANAYDGLVVLGRPALMSDDARLEALFREVKLAKHGARVLVTVPDQADHTGGVPTIVMAQLASRLADRARNAVAGVRVDVGTAPLAWRDPVSDRALVGALARHVGARAVLVLSNEVGIDEDAARWRDVMHALDVQGVASNALHPADQTALTRWRPPRSRRGLVVFFTGLSGSGKSTIARSLAAMVSSETSRTVSLLDGDVVRQLLSSGLGFDRDSRSLNIRRIGFVATEVARHGGLAICAPVAPYAADRDDVREMVGQVGDFVLIHVSTPLEECERRDFKGLYAKARQGLIPQFTGVSDPYEAPTNAEITVDTTEMPNDDAVARVFDYLAGRGWLEKRTL